MQMITPEQKKHGLRTVNTALLHMRPKPLGRALEDAEQAELDEALTTLRQMDGQTAIELVVAAANAGILALR